MLAGDLELAALVLDLQEQARVLDRQGGLGGERSQELDDLRRELARGLPDHGEAAEQVILADEGNGEQGPVSGAHERTTHPTLGGCFQDVRHLDRLLYLRESSGRSFSFADRRGEHRLDDLGLKMLTGAWHEDLALLVVLVDHPGIGARELRGPGHDRAQHGLQIQGGTDRLARPRRAPEAPLPIVSARSVRACSSLEQPRVLDGDHRLVGEGLEQRDLVVGEPAGFAAGHRDRPDRLVVTKQRHHSHASVATGTSAWPAWLRAFEDRSGRRRY